MWALLDDICDWIARRVLWVRSLGMFARWSGEEMYELAKDIVKTVWGAWKAFIGFFVPANKAESAATWVTAALVIGAVLVVIVGCRWLLSDSQSANEIKADTAAQEGTKKDAETNVQTEKIEKQAQEIQAAEKDAVNARKRKEKADRTDSSEYNGAEVEDKFCSRFPNDSTCADWRRRNGR